MQDAIANTSVRHLTLELADFVTKANPSELSDAALTWAAHALLDWTGVTLAARDEDCVRILIEELVTDADQGAAGAVTLVGQNRKARLFDAALINGTASHALDYDDVNSRLGGHPSVVTIPVALALSEETGASGLETLAAIVVGFEVACAVGNMTAQSHYAKGFHNTGTVGTFGAAATAAYLLKLDAEKTQIALSLAASQAAGLKCNFGTMTKPFHAGAAAMNGLRAARLAARGFTAVGNAIETRQGFVDTQVPSFDTTLWTSPFEQSDTPSARSFGIEYTLFKYHAACYGTHGVLEACHQLRRDHGVSLEDVTAIKLFVPARSQGQCDIAAPDTGLAMKFSTQHLAIAALGGIDTASIDVFSAKTATDPRLVRHRDKLDLQFEPDRDRYIADVEVHTADGRVLTAQGNVGIPATDLDDQWRKLSGKFGAVSTPIIGHDRTMAARTAIAGLRDAPDTMALVTAIA